MAQVSKLLNEDVVSAAEAGFKKLGKVGIIANRLQIILRASKHGITEVCRINGISRTTLTSWIKRLKSGGIESLKNNPKRPQSPLHIHEATIKEWIEQNPNITVRELLIKTKDILSVSVGQTAMRRVIKKLKFAYITPRPLHHKQNKTSHEEFKKKSS